MGLCYNIIVESHKELWVEHSIYIVIFSEGG